MTAKNNKFNRKFTNQNGKISQKVEKSDRKYY